MSDDGKLGEGYGFEQGERETRRLVAQGAVLDLPLRRLLVDAGVGAGMRVLDIGSGAGDVALTAAQLVGPSGSVVGVDQNTEVLETARRRSREMDMDNVAFVAGDVREDLALDGEFDALIGRLVLTHLADPGAALRRLLGRVRPGGIVAFQEAQMQVIAYPPSPLLERVGDWSRRALARRGSNPSAGLALHRTFLSAGLPAPEMRAHAQIMGGPDDSLLKVAVAAVRSLMPVILENGIDTGEEVGIDTLEERLLAEFATEEKVAIGGWFNVDAWARKP
jgi:predicted O-methyltransferase YrrM